jgi:hypothetical protein
MGITDPNFAYPLLEAVRTLWMWQICVTVLARA